MIYEVTMYGITCDECSSNLECDEGYMVFNYEHEAKYIARESEWKEIDGKWYCPDCVERFFEYDWDNDTYVRKEERK